MTQGVPIDRVAVHTKLWNARDRSGKVQIHQKRFAESLGLSGPHICRIIKEFEASGRLKKVGARYRNVGVYNVYDPDDFPGGTGFKATGIGPANAGMK